MQKPKNVNYTQNDASYAKNNHTLYFSRISSTIFPESDLSAPIAAPISFHSSVNFYKIWFAKCSWLYMFLLLRMYNRQVLQTSFKRYENVPIWYHHIKVSLCRKLCYCNWKTRCLIQKYVTVSPTNEMNKHSS